MTSRQAVPQKCCIFATTSNMTFSVATARTSSCKGSTSSLAVMHAAMQARLHTAHCTYGAVALQVWRETSLQSGPQVATPHTLYTLYCRPSIYIWMDDAFQHAMAGATAAHQTLDQRTVVRRCACMQVRLIAVITVIYRVSHTVLHHANCMKCMHGWATCCSDKNGKRRQKNMVRSWFAVRSCIMLVPAH